MQEQLRGWLALIHRQREVHQQIPGYSRLLAFLDFLRRWLIVPLDERAADQFTRLRRQRIRIGTEDLKIASIALVQDAWSARMKASTRTFPPSSAWKRTSWFERSGSLRRDEPAGIHRMERV